MDRVEPEFAAPLAGFVGVAWGGGSSDKFIALPGSGRINSGPLNNAVRTQFFYHG